MARLVVVGAHWDTTAFTDGLNDNGSGVAAVLETARALAEAGCSLRYSVIFVAFDKEEVGSQGSHEFVRSFLLPRFFSDKQQPEFQGTVLAPSDPSSSPTPGAFILDTILNYNATAGSQVVPGAWAEQLAGGVSEEIRRGGSRGDFIAVVSRAAADSRLADTFERHWRRLVGSKGGTGSSAEV